MANKWQIMVLGVVLVQGIGLSAMDLPRLNCSAEARKEVVAPALKQSLEKRNKEPKEGCSFSEYNTMGDPRLEELFKRHPQMQYIPLPI